MLHGLLSYASSAGHGADIGGGPGGECAVIAPGRRLADDGKRFESDGRCVGRLLLGEKFSLEKGWGSGEGIVAAPDCYRRAGG